MASQNKKGMPPILVVSGGQDILRRRFVQQVATTQQGLGWVVQAVDGTDVGAIRDVLGGDAFEDGNILALVSNPEKIPLDLLEKHQASKDYVTTLLLILDGEPDGRTKFGKMVKGDLAGVHRSFPLPTDWKAPDEAATFVVSEFQRLGKKIDIALAKALVDRSGTDLGVLSFEVDKITILANLAGSTTIDPKMAARGSAPIAEASVVPIIDALTERNTRKLAKALASLRRTSRDDPTMRITRLLAASVVKWMQAAYLDSLPPKAAADELKIHPWYFENKIVPAARKWGKAGTVSLVSDLAAAERAVLNGAQNPWVVLTTRLLSACQSEPR